MTSGGIPGRGRRQGGDEEEEKIHVTGEYLQEGRGKETEEEGRT